MKRWELLGEALTPDGTLLALTGHDSEHVILANGKSLMSSRMHGSEEAVATFVCEHVRRRESPCVLVGGLGMGFSLRAALDALPPDARVIVAELVPAVVEWNRGVLGPLANHPLQDRRVTIVIGDVAETIASSGDRFDGVLLDVDNGPDAFTSGSNDWLYSDAGLTAIRRALKSDGVVGVWSAWESRKFEQRLRFNGFDVRVERVRARLKKGGPRHTIFVGTTRKDHNS